MIRMMIIIIWLLGLLILWNNVENIPEINSGRLDFDNPEMMSDIPLKEIIEHPLLNN